MAGRDGFEQQATAVLAGARLSREAVLDTKLLFDDIQSALQDKWPDCIIHPFGSVVTGLGIKSSDADCFVEIPIDCKTPPDKLVMIAKNILGLQPHIFQELFAIRGAKVPIVKFFHDPTRMKCDISFSSLNGVINSNTIRFLMTIDEQILSTTVILKYWSKVHGMCGTNLLPNYAFVMMIIFYLQNENILPALNQLQQSVKPLMVNCWNMSYDDDMTKIPKISSNTPLHRLVGGFFKFYRDFNYEDLIVSPFLGQPVLKKAFQETVPTAFSLYAANVREGRCRPLRLDAGTPPLCVQDMFEHSRNCTVAVHPRHFLNFKKLINHAAQIYELCNKDCGNFLHDILLTTPPPRAPTPAPPRPRLPAPRLRLPAPRPRQPASRPRQPAPRSRPSAPRLQHPAPRLQPPAPRSQPPAPRSQPPAPRSQPPASRSQPPADRPQPLAPRSEPPVPSSQPLAPRSQPPAPRSQPPAPRSQPPAPRSKPPAPRSQPPTPPSQPPTLRSQFHESSAPRPQPRPRLPLHYPRHQILPYHHFHPPHLHHPRHAHRALQQRPGREGWRRGVQKRQLGR